jgi:hypothetical protein
MKRRRIAAAALAAALAASVALTACKKDETGASPQGNTSAETAPGETAASARDLALGILDEIDAAAVEEQEVDFTDEAQVEAYVAERREIYERLQTLELDGTDADAQARLREGAEKMLTYLDGLPAYCKIRGDGSDESARMRDELSAAWASAVGDIDAGKKLLAPEASES